MLELKTSDGDDGRSLSIMSPLGWNHGVLRHERENNSLDFTCKDSKKK